MPGLYKCSLFRDVALILFFLCSAAGHGVPNVSAQALKYLFIFKNDPVPANGTSCAFLACLSLHLFVSFFPADRYCLDSGRRDFSP